MTKLKTKKSAQKRFSLFRYVGIKRAQANRTHKLRKKTTAQKRALRNSLRIVRSNEIGIKRLLPYMK